jgi:serine/threonine protein kinase/alpha-tubulin suppressor-like RCC1 family protein
VGVSIGGSEDNPTGNSPDRDAMAWRAEDLLAAVLDGTGTDPDSQAAANDPVRHCVHRYLDGADGGLLTIRLGEADRTYTVPTIGQPTGPAAWPDTPPVEVPNHELLVCIGMGGFGQVWLARHELTEHHRACKLIPGSMSLELDGLRRLKQRVPAHPNLFPIEEVGRAGDWIYCLMPLADSGTDAGTVSGVDAAMNVTLYRPLSLRQHLQDRGRVPGAEAARIAADLLEGLAHLHAHGVTHGDIKPANILRLNGRWTLCDYGLARDLSQPGGSGHTPGFIPVEGPGTAAADIYAVGVVCMMMVTGRGAADLPSVLAAKPGDLRSEGIDPRWQPVIASLCHADPEARLRAVEKPRRVLSKLARRDRRGLYRSIAAAAVVLGGMAVGAKVLLIDRPRSNGEPNLSAYVYDHPQANSDSSHQLDRTVSAARRNAHASSTEGVAVGFGSILSRSSSHMVLDPKIATHDNFVAAITQDGRVIVWGANQHGFLDVPTGIVDPVRVAVSKDRIYVIQSDGRLIAWGYSEHGATDVPEDLGPVIDVAGLYGLTAIAVRADGTIRGWGMNWACKNSGGPLDFDPEKVRDVERVSAYNAHWLYQTRDGYVGGVGCNSVGQIDVPPLKVPVIQLAASESWSCLLLDSNTAEQIIAFGFRTDAWLKPPAYHVSFLRMAAGRYFGLALNRSGRIFHWGDNRKGQDQIPSGLTGVVDVKAGAGFGIAVHEDGTLTMWGDNEFGQLDWPKHERIRLGDPDLDYNGIADWIDILRGEAMDENRNGVPDHAETAGANE